MKFISEDNHLEHFGVPGMKWGHRKAPSRLEIKSNHSAVTKKVIKDYNSMDDHQFKMKYQTSKGTYAKRVEKYGDPYKNSPLAKHGKKIEELMSKHGKTKLSDLKAWGKEAGKVTKSNFTHPIITSRADRESKNADTTKNRVRRTMIYQNTNDLKDVNSRIEKMLAEKKKK